MVAVEDWIRAVTRRPRIKALTGLFVTEKEISLHALLKDLVEEEHMVVQSGAERFANKYNLDVAEHVEASMPREDATNTNVDIHYTLSIR